MVVVCRGLSENLPVFTLLLYFLCCHASPSYCLLWPKNMLYVMINVLYILPGQDRFQFQAISVLKSSTALYQPYSLLSPCQAPGAEYELIFHPMYYLQFTTAVLFSQTQTQQSFLRSHCKSTTKECLVRFGPTPYYNVGTKRVLFVA
jgi:hypothetical protein